MIYLDYAATTPVNKEVLDSFCKVSLEYPGNPNSLHKLGVESKKLMDAATHQVASLLNVKDTEVIFTSGATESNNTAIMGIVDKYKERGKHIITTKLEHSSILATMNYLKNNGYTVDYVKITEDGLIDLDNLKELLNKDTVLVSICCVNSEIGLRMNVEEVGEILKDYPRTIFHVDGTQAIGKTKVDLKNIDLFSCSAHKIYGLKGVGALIKKENIDIEPILHGGKSQTVFRSGTPALALIVSMAKAMKLVLTDFDEHEKYILSLKNKIKESIKDIDYIYVNEGINTVPNVLNMSVMGVKPETLLHALEEKDIYISTKTACSSDSGVSLSVYTLTHDEERSLHSIRVSLSHLTKEEEVEEFIKVFKEKAEELHSLRG